MDTDPLAALNTEEREALAELAKARASGKMSRRDYLQAGGLLLGGGLVGGGAGLAATGQASADASTSDGDGDVGLPGDRVDVFADGVDAATVSTEDLQNADGDLRRYGAEFTGYLNSSNELVILDADGDRVRANSDHGAALETWASNAGNAEILLLAGTYTINAQCEIYQATLRGVGNGDQPGVSDNQTVLEQADGTDVYTVVRGRDRSGLENLIIDGNKGNNNTGIGFEANGRGEVSLEDITVRNTPEDGIALLSGCEDSRVSGVTTKDCDGWGVKTVGRNNTVIGCTVKYCTLGISFEDSGVGDAKLAGSHVRGGTGASGIQVRSGGNVTVEGCTVDGRDSGGTAALDKGVIVTEAADTVTVTGTIVHHTTGSGFAADTNQTSTSDEQGDIIFGDCIAHNCGTHGFNAQNTQDVICDGCIAYGNSNDGIRFTGSESSECIASGCRSRNNGADGLTVGGDNCSVTGCVLTGNTGSSLADNGTGTATAGNVT